MHRSRSLLGFVIVVSLVAPSWAAPPKKPSAPSSALPSQIEAPTGDMASPAEAEKATPKLAPGTRPEDFEKPAGKLPRDLEAPTPRRPTEPVRRPKSLDPPMLPKGARDGMTPGGGSKVEPATPIRELVAADVRIVEIARAGRKVAITGRADRAIPSDQCCDLVLLEGPSGSRALWRGHATVVRVGSGYGFVAMATHSIPGGSRQQLIAELQNEDRRPENNRLMKWVGSEGGAEVTESDRGGRAVGGFVSERRRNEIREVSIGRSGLDWAEVDVSVSMDQRQQSWLRVDAEGIPAAGCQNGRGETQFVVSEYTDGPGSGFTETFRVVCRSPSQDASGRIKATFLDANGSTPMAERSAPWTVRASEGTIDRRAARGDAQAREIAGTDAAPADLSVGISFSPLDGRPHFAPVTVRNRGGSPSPPVQLRIRFVRGTLAMTSADLLRNVPSLDPNESWSERVVLGTPSNLRWEEIGAGEAASTLVATVDSSGILYESNEANNEASTATQSSGMRWRLRFVRPSR
ncbi:MAG: hypothetical protein CL910_19210 [Deltaproteobacteria bacterium]|nr:hypothetical protein [Deltaproteobacteria bacterium]